MPKGESQTQNKSPSAAEAAGGDLDPSLPSSPYPDKSPYHPTPRYSFPLYSPSVASSPFTRQELVQKELEVFSFSLDPTEDRFNFPPTPSYFPTPSPRPVSLPPPASVPVLDTPSRIPQLHHGHSYSHSQSYSAYSAHSHSHVSHHASFQSPLPPNPRRRLQFRPPLRLQPGHIRTPSGPTTTNTSASTSAFPSPLATSVAFPYPGIGSPSLSPLRRQHSSPPHLGDSTATPSKAGKPSPVPPTPGTLSRAQSGEYADDELSTEVDENEYHRSHLDSFEREGQEQQQQHQDDQEEEHEHEHEQQQDEVEMDDLTQDDRDILVERLTDLVQRLMGEQGTAPGGSGVSAPINDACIMTLHAKVDEMEAVLAGGAKNTANGSTSGGVAGKDTDDEKVFASPRDARAAALQQLEGKEPEGNGSGSPSSSTSGTYRPDDRQQQKRKLEYHEQQIGTHLWGVLPPRPTTALSLLSKSRNAEQSPPKPPTVSSQTQTEETQSQARPRHKLLSPTKGSAINKAVTTSAERPESQASFTRSSSPNSNEALLISLLKEKAMKAEAEAAAAKEATRKVTAETKRLTAELERVVRGLQARREESDHLHALLVERAEAAAGRILELEKEVLDLEDEVGGNESELKHLRIKLRAVETLCHEFITPAAANADPELMQSIENWKSDWARLRDQMSSSRKERRRKNQAQQEDPHRQYLLRRLGVTLVPGEGYDPDSTLASSVMSSNLDLGSPSP